MQTCTYLNPGLNITQMRPIHCVAGPAISHNRPTLAVKCRQLFRSKTWNCSQRLEDKWRNWALTKNAKISSPRIKLTEYNFALPANPERTFSKNCDPTQVFERRGRTPESTLYYGLVTKEPITHSALNSRLKHTHDGLVEKRQHFVKKVLTNAKK